MVYHLDLNNCHIAYNSPELPKISQFLDSFISLTNEEECTAIQRLFHCYKRRQYEFIVTIYFWNSVKNLSLFWIKALYISSRYD